MRVFERMCVCLLFESGNRFGLWFDFYLSQSLEKRKILLSVNSSTSKVDKLTDCTKSAFGMRAIIKFTQNYVSGVSQGFFRYLKADFFNIAQA